MWWPSPCLLLLLLLLLLMIYSVVYIYTPLDSLHIYITVYIVHLHAEHIHTYACCYTHHWHRVQKPLTMAPCDCSVHVLEWDPAALADSRLSAAPFTCMCASIVQAKPTSAKMIASGGDSCIGMCKFLHYLNRRCAYRNRPCRNKLHHSCVSLGT
jgi:hypothetical protein